MNELLAQGIVKLVFRKKENNLLRVMVCTLNEGYIPPEEIATYQKALVESGGAKYVVWDVEKNDWRSFYMNSVISYEPVE